MGQAAGVTGLRGVARALNNRGIRTAAAERADEVATEVALRQIRDV